MLDKKDITAFIEEKLSHTDCFPVEISVSPANDIVITIDSSTSVDIDFCTQLSRDFEQQFSRDEEDYSLEIGSAGLTAPITVRGQWEKNIGNPLDILATDGRKLTATLLSLGDDNVTLEYEVKVKPEGAKRPVIESRQETLPIANIKKATLHFTF